MVIILIISAFILFVCLILNLLKVIKTKKTTWFMILAVIFWVLYSCFFWGSLATQVVSDKRKQGMICSYRNFGHNALYGNEGEENYIGLENELRFYQNF